MATFSSPLHAQGAAIIGGMTVAKPLPGELTSSKLALIAPHVATISPDSAELQVHLGDTLSLTEVLLVARDSSGAEIGRFRTFDSTLRPGASLVPSGVRRYTAATVGESQFILAFPTRMWVGRTDAPVMTALKVLVVP